MAYKKRVDDITEQLKRFKRLTHYAVRLVPIVVIVIAVAWFFVLRSPGEQAKTSGTAGATAGAAASTKAKTPDKQPAPKVADDSTAAAKTTEEDDGKDDAGKLPQTGPANTLAIFATTGIAGTLFWEWRLHRARQNS